MKAELLSSSDSDLRFLRSMVAAIISPRFQNIPTGTCWHVLRHLLPLVVAWDRISASLTSLINEKSATILTTSSEEFNEPSRSSPILLYKGASQGKQVDAHCWSCNWRSSAEEKARQGLKLNSDFRSLSLVGRTIEHSLDWTIFESLDSWKTWQILINQGDLLYPSMVSVTQSRRHSQLSIGKCSSLLMDIVDREWAKNLFIDTSRENCRCCFLFICMSIDRSFLSLLRIRWSKTMEWLVYCGINGEANGMANK